MLRKTLASLYYKKLYSSALGQRIRKYIKSENLAEIKPFSKSAVISDLFVWRQSKQWQTTFQIFNISSFIFPDDRLIEKCQIHIYDAEGIFIKKLEIVLNPLELFSLDFSTIDNLKGEVGTFSVFHFSDGLHEISKHASRLTERGYIAYNKAGNSFKNYCHGNLQAVSKTYKGNVKSVVGLAQEDIKYSPQMIFSDSSRFELIYTNPSDKVQEVTVFMYDKHQNIIEKLSKSIYPFGVEVFDVENPDHQIHTVQNSGRIIMWRPIVKKYYQTHFDVLHG